MGKFFTVKIKDKCIVYGEPIRTKRCRSYCSSQCRNKFYNKKYRKQQQQWATNKRAEYAPDKIRCLICGKWYYQVGTHIWYKHKMTCREYRIMQGLDVKRGLLPSFLRELKAKQVFENGTVHNLKAGEHFWFKMGDKQAGRYERSEQTMQRLKHLNKFNKNRKYETISS